MFFTEQEVGKNNPIEFQHFCFPGTNKVGS